MVCHGDRGHRKLSGDEGEGEREKQALEQEREERVSGYLPG